MSEPLMMVHTYTLADAPAYRAKLTDWFGYVASNHPDVLHHKVYVDDAQGQILNLQVHPGPESMERMMQLFMARMDEWTGLIDAEGTHVSVCGDPTPDLVEKLSYGAGPGNLAVYRPLGGFTRLGG
jgi:hypothetical protein